MNADRVLGAGIIGVTANLDRGIDLDAGIVKDIPAPVALFDRELRYIAASPSWVGGFALARDPLAGDRHDELSTAGRAALDEVQRRALAGEGVDDCLVVETDWTQQASGAFLSARPYRDRDGAVIGVIVTLRKAGRPDAVVAMPSPSPGIVERDEFARRVRAALADPDPARGATLVIAVSLDGLRRITNMHGSAIGDQVEKIIAQRLLSGTR